MRAPGSPPSRLFAAAVTALLPALRSLNGCEVLPTERERAERQWCRLRRLHGLAANCLHAQLAPPPFQHAMALAEGAYGPPDAISVAAAAAVSSAFASPPGSGTGGGSRQENSARGGKESLRLAREREAREQQRERSDAPTEAASAEHATKLADGFVSRVIDHALAVDEKIAQLNATWPHIVATFQARVRAEVVDRQLFLKRYEAACRGDTEGTTLETISMPSVSISMRDAGMYGNQC